MRISLIIFFALITSLSFSQKIKFKVLGVADTTVHLVKYFGKNLYYADTAVMKNGCVEFNGAKQNAGMLGLLLPGQKFFQFVYNNEDVSLETFETKDEKGAIDFYKNMKVLKSKENKVFVDYINFISAKKMLVNNLNDEKSKLKPEDTTYKALGDQIAEINKSVVQYQNEIVKNNPDLLWAKYVWMTIDVEIPESPKDDKGNIIDSNFSYKYYRQHFWDHVDFNDDRLVNCPDFHNKLEFLFSKNFTLQHWDTVIKYAYDLCDKLDPKSKAFEYCVSYITSTYGKSNIMGMDKVYLYMVDKYYCSKDANGKSPATWVKPDKLEELCKGINIKKNLVLGVRPPNVILRDTTDVNWKGFYELKSDYTILYFWDPECGHCKKTTPKLETLYQEKFKNRNIEIFAVGKAVGEDFEKWKKFIRDNKLTFINVGVTDKLFKDASDKSNNQEKLINLLRYTTIESLNYQTTYDIFSTPRVFVLDKDKKIIAKGISISQLEDLLDREQGFTDLPKIFPPDPEEDEQMH
jgi:thiol-disulfide isomerase/thioredoxin